MRFSSHPSLDVAISALAADQNGVVRLDDLVDLGLSARAVQRRAASGRLHRRYPGVYSLLPLPLLSRKGHWMAAVLACGDGAVLSHVTAAALHGLRQTDARYVHLTVPRHKRCGHPGIKVHRSTTLTEADVTVVDGIPCTSVARTLFDIAEVISRRPLERAFDQSEMLEVFDLHAIEDQLTRNTTRPGATPVRAVLNEHYIGSTVTESELEEAFLALCRRIDVPQPELHAAGGPA